MNKDFTTVRGKNGEIISLRRIYAKKRGMNSYILGAIIKQMKKDKLL